MQAAQYWKPGETKPRDEDKGRPEKPHKRRERSSAKSRREDHVAEQHSNSSDVKHGGSAKKRGKKSKSKDAERSSSNGSSAIGINAEVSRSAAKPPVAGPSQGLLAMKFMQRKVKADEAQKQQKDRRDKLESDFSSSYAKRLKADKTNDKDRLICRLDEQDPALVVVGRRSFGGFNAVAEAAYDACVRDIAAGERLGQLAREEDRGGGVSDTEMAETLGKNVRGGRR